MNYKYTYIFLAGLLLLFQTGLYGQKQKPKNDSWYDDKPLHFGFSLGFNLMDFSITPNQAYLSTDSLYPDVSRLNPGINIQIVTNFNLATHWDIRCLPGVAFGQRTVKYYRDQVIYNERQRLESSFIEFPVLLKYKGTRLNNVRPYLIGGLNYRYDLAGKNEYDDEKPIYIRLKRSDIYYEFGAGLDFYLPFFKMSVELKVSTGIRDVIVHEPAPMQPQFANAIERMRSQLWILAFHFE